MKGTAALSGSRDQINVNSMSMRPNFSHLANSIDNLNDMPLPDLAPLQVRESVLDASEELDKLTGMALRNLKEILDPPVNFGEPKLVNAKLNASQTVLNTQVRVDEGRLK